MQLADFQDKRIAVLMTLPSGDRRLFRGVASVGKDPAAGKHLRIELEHAQPGSPVFLLHENDWNDQLQRDGQYGCDFYVELEHIQQAAL